MLNQIGIVITRPAHQTGQLCRLLEEQRARPLLFPVLEIVGPADIPQLQRILSALQNYDMAIFISPNAVERAQVWIQAAGGFSLQTKIAAIGQGSAHALARFGINPDFVPVDSFDSEALLALLELTTVSGQRIIIFRGSGGRDFLGTELTRRGANVDYAEVYQRISASPDPQELFTRIARNELHAAIVTSIEGLRNFLDLIGVQGREWLSAIDLVLFSSKTAALARALGLRGKIHIVRPATDQAIIAVLIREFSGMRR